MVTKWTVVEDAALQRIFAYLMQEPSLGLFGSLTPGDLDELEIHVYTDADWTGDLADTKSASGVWVELRAPSCGRTGR